MFLWSQINSHKLLFRLSSNFRFTVTNLLHTMRIRVLLAVRGTQWASMKILFFALIIYRIATCKYFCRKIFWLICGLLQVVDYYLDLCVKYLAHFQCTNHSYWNQDNKSPFSCLWPNVLFVNFGVANCKFSNYPSLI